MNKILITVALMSMASGVYGQNVGIGTTNPVAKLDVLGNVKIKDGTEGSGKVLTSDANGLASWQAPPGVDTISYPVVWICCNPWMTKNLDVSTYRNGDSIPKVTDNQQWFELTTGAYCYYNNDSATYASIYGKLYNWYAVNDPRGLAPEGWHIATDFVWSTVTNCLGNASNAGGPLKEIGTALWNSPNVGATNFTGFNGRPGGFRHGDGTFIGTYLYGYFWSATEQYTNPTSYAWFRALLFYAEELGRDGLHKRTGCSVRCVKDK